MIGASISIYAQVVKSTLGADQLDMRASMTLFTIIGVVFVIIGLVKWMLQRKKEFPLIQREQHFAERLAGVDRINTQEQRIINQAPQIILCPRCRTKNYTTSNFCHMCGQQLKIR